MYFNCDDERDFDDGNDTKMTVTMAAAAAAAAAATTTTTTTTR